MPKVPKPAYTQKNQNFDSEKSPNLHILKKMKKIKNFRLYVGLTGIDELVFDFFDFFAYMQVWWLFTINFFDFFEYMQVLCTFWHQHVDLFWVYAGLVNLKSQTYIFATFEWHDFFQFMFLFQYLSIKFFRTKIQIRIVLISSLIFDNIFIVIQNIDNIILLRMLISWI